MEKDQLPEPSEDKNLDPKFTIIAVGASAGGLEALKTFFDNVSVDFPYSFVIIQHLSPDYKSLMADLLAKNTKLPIHETSDGMEIEEGHIYLIPARKNMTIQGGKLFLTNKPVTSELNLPIDIFFRSLAEEMKERAIGIILSGTGSDGTRGSLTIKESGGLIMVQSPNSAKFDGMPNSAINTGMVDFVLPAEQMPAKLEQYIKHPELRGELDYEQIINDEYTIRRILRFIKSQTNVDFTEYKRPTLARRITRRMNITQCTTLSEYMEYMFDQPEEAIVLYKEFLIGVTKFFRDPEVFEYVGTEILPNILKSTPKSEPVKFWSVGCSSGQEAYSWAITALEAMEATGIEREVKIFATDLERSYLGIAAKGTYPASSGADIKPELLQKYFSLNGDEIVIKPNVRKMIIFSRHNVLEDPPFGKMNLISCRNMMIYMQSSLQEGLLSTLHYALRLHGTLVLGPSGTLGNIKNVFSEVHRTYKIFSNHTPAKFLQHVSIKSPDLPMIPSKNLSTASQKQMALEFRFIETLTQSLLSQFSGAAVYVDEEYNIIHGVGDLYRFLGIPREKFSVNLMRMVPTQVGVKINNAIRQAKVDTSTIYNRTALYLYDVEEKAIHFSVKKVDFDNKSTLVIFQVLFFEQEYDKDKLNVTSVSKESFDVQASKYIDKLEEELLQVKDNLQNSIEEAETSNEELQATNEELVAANEELQSTNEELQSVNEELHTVNAEYQDKLEELAAVNSDLDNLLKSSNVGTIFLDRGLRIKKFTTASRRLMKLIDGDIGRPLEHFRAFFINDSNEALINRCKNVLETGQRSEKEIISRDNIWFVERIHPFIDSSNEITGLVLSYIDIHDLKTAEAAALETERMFTNFSAVTSEAIILTDSLGTIISWNNAAEATFGFNHNEAIGAPFTILMPEKYHEQQMASLEQANLGEDMKMFDKPIEVQGIRKNGQTFTAELNLSAWTNKLGKKYYSSVIRDVTERRKYETALQLANDNLRMLHESTTLLSEQKLDLNATLKAVTIICTKSLATFAVIRLLDKNEDLELAAFSHRDRKKERIFGNFLKKYPTERGVPNGEYEVLDVGETVIIETINEEILRLFSSSDEMRKDISKLNITSGILIPLKTVSNKYGTLVLARDNTPDKFTENDINLLKAIAKQATQYIENAILLDTTKKLNESQRLVMLESQESERKYRDLYNNAPEMMLSVDIRTGNIIEFNQTLLKKLGYKADEILGIPLINLHPKEQHERVNQSMKNFIQLGYVMEEEFTVIAKNGSLVEVLLNATAVKDDKNKVVRSRTVWTDITELHKVKSDVQKREREYRTLVQNSPQMIIRFNLNLQYEFVNKAWEDSVKISYDDVKGKTAYDIGFPKHVIDEYNEHIKIAIESKKPYNYDSRSEIDGAYFSNSLVPELDEDGHVESILCVHRDVSQLYEALEQVERLASIVEHNQDAIFALTSNLIITNCNDGVQTLFGYKEEDLVNTSLLDLLNTIDKVKFMKAAKNVMRGMNVEEIQTTAYTANNEKINLSVIMSPIGKNSTLETKIIGISIIARNITEQIEAFKILERHSNTLESSNKALEQFAFVASHDLQQPVRTIASFVDLFTHQMGEIDNPKAKVYLERIKSSSLRMGSLIDDLLQYSRVSTSKIVVKPIDLNKLVEGLLSDLEADIKAQNASITVDKLKEINSDSFLLGRLFQNLISNAMKFKRQDIPVKVRISGRSSKNYYTIKIEDNGIGLAPEHMNVVFDVFKRLHSKSAFPGNGIGLSMCRRIISLMGGDIWFEEKSTPGAVLKFKIPKKD